MDKSVLLLTISEVHINIVGPNIRRHSNDGKIWAYFLYTDSCGNSVQVGHNDIHQNQVELGGAMVDLVHGFKSVALKKY